MRSDAGGSILSVVESIMRRMGIEKNIDKLTPGINPKNRNEEELSFNITALPYPKFVEFLQAIYESGSTINVKKAKIAPAFDNRSVVNAEMTLVKMGAK
jgi:hypothetical protein